jgi:hypothetical protein
VTGSAALKRSRGDSLICESRSRPGQSRATASPGKWLVRVRGWHSRVSGTATRPGTFTQRPASCVQPETKLLTLNRRHQLSHHRRCRPAGDETEFDPVVEFLGVSGHRGRSSLGASEPVTESDPEPLSTPDYATGWQQPRSTFVRFPWIEVPSLRRVRRSDGSFARALCRSGYS